ncbi:MFS transporter [Haloactinomyces albus]|uniref:MFS family permease n=1 Tax=Haloactinomyces albus TaxID=1352928 RepID=A0AAE4CKS8_9ACTN|nr:MFS transporter [Haloactinomyces albus]MDR7301405.1 MFS family permease [Haloactinomyces albus]
MSTTRVPASPAPAPLRRAGTGALAALLASATLGVMAGAVISPVVALIRDDFDLGAGQAGVVITTHSLLIALSGPLVGALIDRTGTRRVLAAGLVAYAVFGAAGALATGYPALLASRAAFGVAAAAVINGLTVSLLNLWQDRADTVMGYRSTAGSIGGILWPMLGGALGGISWRGPFTVYLIALPIAAAAIWLVPDARPPRGTSADTAAGSTADTPVRISTLLRRTPALLWIYALSLTTAVLLYAVMVFVPQRLARLDVTDPLAVSVFIAVTTAATALVGLVYGRIRRHLRYYPIFLVGLTLPIAGFAILAAATRPWMLLAGTPLLGLGMGLIMPATSVLVGTAVPRQVRGRAISYLTSMMLLGQFASPLLLGPIAGPHGIRAVFLAAAILAALIALAAATAFRPDRLTAAASVDDTASEFSRVDGADVRA